MPINEVSEYIGDNTSADEIMKVQENGIASLKLWKNLLNQIIVI